MTLIRVCIGTVLKFPGLLVFSISLPFSLLLSSFRILLPLNHLLSLPPTSPTFLISILAFLQPPLPLSQPDLPFLHRLSSSSPSLSFPLANICHFLCLNVLTYFSPHSIVSLSYPLSFHSIPTHPCSCKLPSLLFSFKSVLWLMMLLLLLPPCCCQMTLLQR